MLTNLINEQELINIDIVSFTDTCTTDPVLEKLWQDPMKWMWINGYDVQQASGKALQSVHDYIGTSNNDFATLACVSYAYFYKSGEQLWKAYQMTAYAIFRSSSAKGIVFSNDTLSSLAEAAAKKFSPTFKIADCSS